MNLWDRRPDETDPAFAAFKIYLECEPRSSAKVAEKIHKSPALIRRWASKYDWQERARAWDSSILEQVRERIATERGKAYLEIWDEAKEQRAFAMKHFRSGKLRPSMKSVNEVYQAAKATQLELIDKLAPDEVHDVRIIIEDAEAANDEES